jgi:hypothetical protein
MGAKNVIQTNKAAVCSGCNGSPKKINAHFVVTHDKTLCD